MSSNATIIGIILFLVFVVPIFYAIIKSKANKRNVEQLKAKLITQHQLAPTDTFEDFGIQHFILDANAKKLLHLEIVKSKITQQNLWTINDLKGLKADYSHYTSPTNESIIGKIHLRITKKDGDQSAILIYDENTGNMALVSEYRNSVENLVSKVNSLRG